MSLLKTRVAVIGAAGGIGQPLSLLLKQNPKVTSLALFDVNPLVHGVRADLSHVNRRPVDSFTGGDMAKALEGADIIVVPAGVPRKPGMTRDDLFNTNASIVKDIANTVAKVAPKATFLIITNPVNSTVPLAAEILKKAGVYDRRKVIGVTYLDVMRATTFLSAQGSQFSKIKPVPVIGGHAGNTIVPLFSWVKQPVSEESGVTLDDKSREELTKRTQFGGDEVVQAKGGAGSATLSMAAAAHIFTDQVISGRNGDQQLSYGFVENTTEEYKECSFFARPIVLDEHGASKLLKATSDHSFEKQKIKEMLGDLAGQIKKGIDFAKKS